MSSIFYTIKRDKKSLTSITLHFRCHEKHSYRFRASVVSRTQYIKISFNELQSLLNGQLLLMLERFRDVEKRRDSAYFWQPLMYDIREGGLIYFT